MGDAAQRRLQALARQLSSAAGCSQAAGGEWQHLKVMRGHKGAVNSLAVHPSGKLALSVAR